MRHEFSSYAIKLDVSGTFSYSVVLPCGNYLHGAAYTVKHIQYGNIPVKDFIRDKS
jgi:hypothetical protein